MNTRHPRLTNDQKHYIVQSLAQFESPSTVVAAVKANFGVVVGRQNVEAYDPTKRAGRSLAPRWRDLFERTREACRRDFSDIGIAHLSVRLRALDRMGHRAEERGDYRLVLDILRQAAMEVGGMFSNRREFVGVPAPVASAAVIYDTRPIPAASAEAATAETKAQPLRLVPKTQAPTHTPLERAA